MHIKVIHTKLDVTLKLNTTTIKKETTNETTKTTYRYLVCITRLTLPKEFLTDNNDSKLTLLGGRLFQTLIIRSLKMFSHMGSRKDVDVAMQYVQLDRSLTT